MKLSQTRAVENENLQSVDFSYALLNPSSAYGGLYAPTNLPVLDKNFFSKAINLNYKELAIEVISKFDFDVDIEVFKKAVKRYARFDIADEPVQIKKLDSDLYINELYHGPTRAFKDMALQPFGEILSQLAINQNKQYLIICATSGDTGPATLETFSNMPNIKVVCLYPKDGTSEVQRLQMVNAAAQNLKVIGINGNFDDTQNALKTLLASEIFKENLKKLNISLSAANSVNFGRILFQIIYYIYSYIWLLKNAKIGKDKSFDVIVPSGNFGNALGAYYAKKMGVKIGKIKIVSNKNNILTEFFQTGIYNLNGKSLQKTISPAMDILISSNIERLLFDKFGAARTKQLMDKLKNVKKYELNKTELESFKYDFEADFCDDLQCESYIKEWAKKGVAIDPHTATCFKMTQNLNNPTIVISTAHWVKFAPSMFKAIKNDDLLDEKMGLKILADEFGDTLPESILRLFDKESIHNDIVNKDEIEAKILEWVKL
jgi:threonine synthase